MLEKANTMPKNEQEQFLQDTEKDVKQLDVLDAPLIPEGTSQEAGEGEKGKIEDNNKGEENDDGQPRNRRERRLTAKLQAERESSMFLAGKLEARTEAEKALSSEEADYLKGIERIYGTDSPEALLATDLLKKAITGARDDAETRAYDRIKGEREKEQLELRDADKELDSMIDEIEETYDVDLTEAQEKAYFGLLTRMSPKDRDGNVINYADPHAVWEVFQEKLQSRTKDTRAKDMSSRSMTQSGASKESNLNDDVTARFLKEQGII